MAKQQWISNSFRGQGPRRQRLLCIGILCKNSRFNERNIIEMENILVQIAEVIIKVISDIDFEQGQG